MGIPRVQRCDLIMSGKGVSVTVLVLGPLDKHILQGYYPVGANMGGYYCHCDLILLPVCVGFLLHSVCDENTINSQVQTDEYQALVCLFLCMFYSKIYSSVDVQH